MLAEEVPQGFHSLGHYCQRTDQLLRGYILAARASKAANTDDLPPLKKPVGYTLVWSVNTEKNGGGYFWLPNPPVGCKAMGVICMEHPTLRERDKVTRCSCWYCTYELSSNQTVRLRIFDPTLHAMPNLNQGKSQREPINSTGSNLPSGGSNDMEFWIDLPEDEEAKSNLKNGGWVDSSKHGHTLASLTLECISKALAEYLGTGGGVAEPCWLQYMREWGPLVEFSIENIVDLFPIALYGEEGPTGPKEKDNWEGDELC
ncbi:hypothetical protein Bca52824_085273 [Brassica carinata]|uniref:Uncharacterized protein n=1 Tax=Brassica carinata TaxID=52824 RepID=A0A8X7P6T5_BRACI|nr:hypothetical protein Bca52824_085273 [Brassica carinata]